MFRIRHARLEEVFGPRRIVMQQLKNSYWFSHAALQSKAKVVLWRCLQFAWALGEFDIAVMGAVLLHCRDPLRIVEQCGKERNHSSLSTSSIRTWKARRSAVSAPTPENFLLAHVVAFQHAIFHSVSGGDGIHGRDFDAPAVSPRKSAHAFHYRRERESNYALTVSCLFW